MEDTIENWMEDTLRWKTTLNVRGTLMEDNIGWKRNLDGRLHLMEDDLGWEIILDGVFMFFPNINVEFKCVSSTKNNLVLK